jgi:hypothetical protein
MATQRSIRLTNPRLPCPGQPDADSGLVHARGLIDHHLDDTRRYVEAAGLSASTTQEDVGRLGLLTPCIRLIYPTAKLCGTAVTVLRPGVNWMLRVATEQLEPGDVVVATACRAECVDGLSGELLGQVIDGGHRNVSGLEAMNFPVFSRAINSKGHGQGQSGLGDRPGWSSSCRMRGRYRRGGPPTRGQ